MDFSISHCLFLLYSYVFLFVGNVGGHLNHPCEVFKIYGDTNMPHAIPRYFSTNSGNCSTYKYELQIKPLPNRSICTAIKWIKISKHSYFQFDLCRHANKTDCAPWSRHKWTTVLCAPRNYSTLLTFHKTRSDIDDVQDEAMGGYFYYYTLRDQDICPDPMIQLEGTYTLKASYMMMAKECSYKVSVKDGKRIAGTIMVTRGEGEKSFTIYEEREVYTEDGLILRWYSVTVNASRTFESGSSSIAILFHSSASSFSYEIQLREIDKDCTCFQPAYSLSTSETAYLVTPGIHQGGCPRQNCSTIFTVAQSFPAETKYCVLFNITQNMRRLDDVIEFLVDGKLFNFHSLDAFDATSLCFDTSTPIQFDYRAADRVHKKDEGLGMQISVVTIPPGCICNPNFLRTPDDLGIIMRRNCPDIDCLFEVGATGRARHSTRVINMIKCHFLLPDTLTVDYRHSSVAPHKCIGSEDASYEVKEDIFPQPVRVWYSHRRPSTELYQATKDQARGNISIALFQIFASTTNGCNCPQGNISVIPGNAGMVFKSPDWPEEYCNDLRCEYSFIAPEDHHIETRFDNFYLEQDADMLLLYDGTDRNVKPLFKGTGKMLPGDPIVTKSNVMSVLFHTDDEIVFGGFNASVLAVPNKTNGTMPITSSTSHMWMLFAVIPIVALCVVVIVLYRTKSIRRLSFAPPRW